MDRIAIGFLGCKDGTTELSRVSFRSMYEDGSVMVKFFPSCWLDCLVGVLFDRRLVSVGLVLSCFFFFVWLGPMSSDMEPWFECKGVGVAPRGWIGGRRAVNHGARGEARRSVPSASATQEGEDEDVVGIVA